ncbi:MAG: DNA topoisomerase 3 [Verrucomicrobiota bacterium]
MKVVLAEKPSVARDIAAHLGANQRKNGWLEGNDWAVTWAFGHLVELQEPEDYDPQLKSWKLGNLPIIPDKFLLRPRREDSARQQLETIKRLFEGGEELVCATDAGREGELIFRYIQIWSGCDTKPFKRLWISSLTKSAIKRGFESLAEGQDFDNLYQAARCRSEADWIVGLNSTRFFTVEYGKRNLLLSIGRVQTPILAMIVGRDSEIENFKPEDFWEIHTVCRETKFRHTRGKFQREDEAKAVVEKITGQPLVVRDVVKKDEASNPPLLFDLTELQREMNRRHGFTADQTLRIAQSLYEAKHLTYPRTDSRYLSTDLQPTIPPLLRELSRLFPKGIEKLDLENLSFTKRIVDDKKVSDHHAIIPTDVLPGSLSDDEKKVYKAVATRLLAVFYPACIKAVTTVESEAAGERFRARGTVLVDAGWQGLYPELYGERKPAKKVAKKKAKEAPDEPQEMPHFQIDESNPHEPSIEKYKTTAPRRFTEATLLALMETAGKIVEDEALKEALKDKGVGTPATRASIIEVLIQRKYVERKKKNLVSTEAGRLLISLVQDERLKSPELTGDWEFRLKQMERGEYNPEKFMDEVASYTREILDHTSAKTINYKNLGPCPECGAPVMKGRTGYGCSRWNDGCRFVIWEKSLGATVTPEMARELILNKATLEPHGLVDKEKKVFAYITLGKKGKIGYRPVEDGQKSGVNEIAIGLCPVCASEIVEGKRGFGCVNWKNGCKFVIWKRIAQKEITSEIAKALLEEGKTDELEGFKSKAGKDFSAKLKVVGNEVKFDFS